MGEGADSQTFSIHKDIAVRFSDFLAAACRNGWKEAADGIVNLPDEDSTVFEIFEAFIHSGSVYSQRAGDTFTSVEGETLDHEWTRLADAWLLGETLQASAFKDAVVDACVDKLRQDNSISLRLQRHLWE